MKNWKEILMELMKRNEGDIQDWPAGSEGNHKKSQ
jgi:hypothetical protein